MHRHPYRQVVAHYVLGDNTPIPESAICCCCEDEVGKRMSAYNRAVKSPVYDMTRKLFPDDPTNWAPARAVTSRYPFRGYCVFCGRPPSKRQKDFVFRDDTFYD